MGIPRNACPVSGFALSAKEVEPTGTTSAKPAPPPRRKISAVANAKLAAIGRTPGRFTQRHAKTNKIFGVHFLIWVEFRRWTRLMVADNVVTSPAGAPNKCHPPYNNLVENDVRPSVIGRKRWLFIGHPDAGWRSAVIYTIIQSCRRRAINPEEYLADVLNRLPAMKIAQVKELLPSRWKPS